MSSSATLSDQAKWMRLGMQATLFPNYNKFRRRITEYAGIAPPATILDFGCGTGLLEEFIIKHMSESEKEMGGKITGVDTGKELIEIARGNVRHENIEFMVIDDSGKLPFADNSFDIVISSLVFHLLSYSQKETALKEIHRVLKPGGKALFAEIGKPYNLYGYWMKFLTLKIWIKFWPYEANSIDSFNGKLQSYIHSAGFKDLKTSGKLNGYIYFMTCN